MCRAAVKVPSVAVVALFSGFNHTVAARSIDEQQRRFQTTTVVATIAIRQVSVIALLPLLLGAIATDRNGRDLFQPAERGAAVTIRAVAVVALFARIDFTITAQPRKWRFDDACAIRGAPLIRRTGVSQLALFAIVQNAVGAPRRARRAGR